MGAQRQPCSGSWGRTQQQDAVLLGVERSSRTLRCLEASTAAGAVLLGDERGSRTLC